MKGPDYTLDHDEVSYGQFRHPDGSIQSSPYEEPCKLTFKELKVKEEIGMLRKQLALLKEYYAIEEHLRQSK